MKVMQLGEEQAGVCSLLLPGISSQHHEAPTRDTAAPLLLSELSLLPSSFSLSHKSNDLKLNLKVHYFSLCIILLIFQSLAHSGTFYSLIKMPAGQKSSSPGSKRRSQALHKLQRHVRIS